MLAPGKEDFFNCRPTLRHQIARTRFFTAESLQKVITLSLL